MRTPPPTSDQLCVKSQNDNVTELWRFSIDGGAPHRLLVMGGMTEVRVNPDGRRIAFSVGQGFSELWVMENFLPVPATRKQ